MAAHQNSAPRRFYIFTGKGGVGKSLLSATFSIWLKKNHYNVLHYGFEKSPFSDVLELHGVRMEQFDFFESTQKYVSQKLGSEIIAKWVVKAPFFRHILQMIPGMEYVICLGDLAYHLERNSDQIIVLDSPASGHTITMLESLFQFKEMFRKGKLAQDIERVLEIFQATNTSKINICTLPQTLAFTEAEELVKDLEKYHMGSIELFVNNSLSCNQLIKENKEQLPEFLRKMIENETELFANKKEQIKASLPHVPSLEYSQLVTEILPFMETFV